MMYGVSNHSCPRCGLRLFLGQASGVTLHGCGRCGGVWLGAACARRIAESLPQDSLELARRLSLNTRDGADTSPPVACVICAQPMSRTRAAAAGVDIDVCDHGTWYDRKELEKIAQAIADSGFRRAGAAGAALAVGAASVASVAAMQAGSAQGSAQSPLVDAAVEIGTEVALEVGSEVVIEGAFSVVGWIIGAIFD